MLNANGKTLALAGGVGGAKLALGLAHCLPPGELVIVVNTADDEEFHGLHIAPDLDTMMYTLAGLSNPDTGWGLQGDTFAALEMLRRYGADTWFNLGDRDLATHIRRTQLLGAGATLAEVTGQLCQALGVEQRIVPMTNDAVRTLLDTDDGTLTMQQYFVQRRAQPRVNAVRYAGADSAAPSPEFAAALEAAERLVVCPSNPILSVQPILAVGAVRQRIAAFRGPRIIVSPIVGDDAVSGPAGKLMGELGQEVSVAGLARQYADVGDILVIDYRDARQMERVAAAGLRPAPANAIMRTLDDKIALAREILALSR